MARIDESPKYEVIKDAFASCFHAEGVKVKKISGCIYRKDGTRVDISERLSGYKGDLVINNNLPVHTLPSGSSEPGFAPGDRLAGRSLYLGHYMGSHYGHFITEGLAACWYLVHPPDSQSVRSEDFDHFVFHPFLFGAEIPEFVAFCFQALGIDPGKIRLVGREPVFFDEIVVPERLFKLNHSVHPEMNAVYDSIKKAARSRNSDKADHGIAENTSCDKVYVSRRLHSWRSHDRVVVNENQIENIFSDAGYVVVYPEKLKIKDQIRVFSEACTIAGLSGSALHNSLFMQKNSTLIELGDPRYEGNTAPNQQLCNKLSGVNAVHIPFNGKVFGLQPVYYFGLNPVRKYLDRSSEVKNYPNADSPLKTGTFNATAIYESFEMILLTTIPSLRYIYRKFKSLFKQL